MQEFMNRHPWIMAREQFMAGRIPIVQAVGMMASDREFIAEAEAELATTGLNIIESARQIVTQVWLPLLVEQNAQGA